ncbi:hypothetical protein [Phenylobacterium sp.]|uniref:hypothetical protein n=1 Tax=Phenylobacterium sp. TaxID=1871053 RepID=UPI0035B07E0F
MTEHVDPALTGVWRREVITTPSGYRDETTRVFWLQTRSWYADIRVPAARPGRPQGAGLADYTAEELVELAAMQGFAGELSADATICRWRRDVDFQPPSPSPDEGTWELDGEVMIERGIHADYEEIWRLQPQSRGALIAFELAGDAAAPGRKGLLVIAGDHFLSIQGRVSPLPVGETLKEIVEAALARGDLEAAHAALSMPIAYGRIAGAAAPWQVTLSTWPWLEGQSLWPAGAASFDQSAQTLRLSGSDLDQAWRLLDSSEEISQISRCLRLPATMAAPG